MISPCEYIWIGCPYCIEMKPYLSELMTKHESLALILRHSTKNEIWERDARLFYALDQLNQLVYLDELMEFYVELRRAKTPPEQEDFNRFFSERGLDHAEIMRIADGADVNALIDVTKAEMTAIDLKSVPTLVVNGKYMVLYDNDLETNEQRMALAEYLMALE
ncbi:thioredoxin domain-containing protein [Ferrimonas pelagia]|uniref:Thioredoxin-like fold domain-containing protein n=1 Tax=Ferrimonas pelagia TaxID=1177826 RepID=A0ABP9ERV8_9GAMM